MRARRCSWRICAISRPGAAVPRSCSVKREMVWTASSTGACMARQHPLPGVLPDRDATDGILRHRGHRGKQVAGHRIRTGRSRPWAPSAKAIPGCPEHCPQATCSRYSARFWVGKTLVATCSMRAPILTPASRICRGTAAAWMSWSIRAQGRRVRGFPGQPHGQTIGVDQRLRQELFQPRREGCLVVDLAAGQVAFQPQGVTEGTGRQRRIGELQ